MASFYLCPTVHKTWFVPGGNSPASGGQLFTYVAGSSTKTTVYKDNAGGASHTNPIVLDSGGNLPSGSEVWIPAGVTIDVVFAPSNDTDPPASPYFTLDDLSGINDISGAASEWVTGPSPTFVSGTQLVLQGDQSGTFKNGRRIRTTNTGGTVYSRISSIAVSAGSTTINVVSDGGTSLDSGLSATAYSLLDPQNVSITEYHVNKDGGSVASAGNGTTDIWGIAGNSLHVTGTNTIRCFSSSAYAGAKRTVIFDGALVLQTSTAFLSVPGGNVSTEAGDRAEILASTTAHAMVTFYERASGIVSFPSQTSGRVFASPASTSGVPSFRALAGTDGASVVFLASTSVNNSSSIDFSGLTGYGSYMAVLDNLIPSQFADLWIRGSTSNGVSFDGTSSYVYSGNSAIAVTGNIPFGSNSQSRAVMAPMVSSTGTYGVVGMITLHNLVAGRANFNGNLGSKITSEAFTNNVASGFFSMPVAVNAVRFMFSNGNISTGAISIYGVRSV